MGKYRGEFIISESSSQPRVFLRGTCEGPAGGDGGAANTFTRTSRISKHPKTMEQVIQILEKTTSPGKPNITTPYGLRT